MMLPTESFRLTDLSLVRVTGRDRAAFLHSFCTNDLLKRTRGDGCEAFVTDAKGHILGHIVVLVQPNELLVASLAPQASSLIQHWERYCICEDVQFVDVSSQRVGIALYGPKASEVIASWGAAPPINAWSHSDVPGPPLAILVVRFPFPDDAAYLLIASADEESALRELLNRSGVHEGSGAMFQALRIVNRLPIYRDDISEENLPQEVNRNDLAISLTKGCYLGQETVARIDALGHVNRLLVGLRLSAASPPAQGTALHSQGTERAVGTIRSAIGSSDRHACLALGMVRREYATPGTTLHYSGGTAEVV